MHDAIIKGDTERMGILLDRGYIRLNGHGFGGQNLWVEEAVPFPASGRTEFLYHGE
jgi:hypothetical protein